MELEVGTLFLRKYIVERLVGQGCMGRVYEARDNALDQRVAIRLIDPEFDNEQVLGFSENDATATGSLRSVHLAELISVGILPSGERCIITDFVDGETLQRRMARLGRMSQVGVTQLLGQLLAGIGAALKVGVAHRDLTPRSIFIAPAKPGPGHVARIVDFGISRLQVLRADPNGVLATNEGDRSSFQYLSPEQLNGLREPDARSNVYTLGVIAYEAVTGRLPFEGKDFATLASNILLEEPRPIEELAPEISAPLVQLIRQSMARSPNNRFQSAEEMLAAIAGLGDHIAGLYTGLESKPPPATPQRDVPLAAVAAAAPDYPPPPPPPPEVDVEAPVVAAAPDYPPPPPPPPEAEEAPEAPVVAAAPKYPAPPLTQLSAAAVVATAPKYPAPPPMEPVYATSARYPAPLPIDVLDSGRPSSGGRAPQATSPGIQPETLSSPFSEPPAPPRDIVLESAAYPGVGIEPIAPPPAVDEPIAPPPVVEPLAAPSKPAAAAESRPIAPPPTAVARPASRPPAAITEPVSNVRQRLEPIEAESPDEFGAYGRPPYRSRKPLVLAVALIGLVGAGVAFALMSTGSDASKAEKPQEIAPTQASERGTAAMPQNATEPAVVTSAVAAPPTTKPSVPSDQATLLAPQPKPRVAVRAVPGAKKSAPATAPASATPAKKPGPVKRDAAKDPYNYR